MTQQDIVTVGLDLADNMSQVQAIAADGEVLVGRQLRRAEVLKFSHHRNFTWLARIHARLPCTGVWLWELGDGVRLRSLAYVEPYVKRRKIDAADA